MPVRIGTPLVGLRMDASVATLLRLATHPLAARLLDGRSLPTGYWTLRFERIDADRLAIVCAPCRLRPPTGDAEALLAARVHVIASRRDGILPATLSVDGTAARQGPRSTRIATTN